jgi:hypothetical protein
MGAGAGDGDLRSVVLLVSWERFLGCVWEVLLRHGRALSGGDGHGVCNRLARQSQGLRFRDGRQGRGLLDRKSDGFGLLDGDRDRNRGWLLLLRDRGWDYDRGWNSDRCHGGLGLPRSGDGYGPRASVFAAVPGAGYSTGVGVAPVFGRCPSPPTSSATKPLNESG